LAAWAQAPRDAMTLFRNRENRDYGSVDLLAMPAFRLEWGLSNAILVWKGV
jgi:hypothetical protein